MKRLLVLVLLAGCGGSESEFVVKEESVTGTCRIVFSETPNPVNHLRTYESGYCDGGDATTYAKSVNCTLYHAPIGPVTTKGPYYYVDQQPCSF